MKKNRVLFCFLLCEMLCATEHSFFNQGDEKLNALPAYNAPAVVLLKNERSWLPDIFIDASFLYYYASQDGMNLATSAQLYEAISATPWLNIETNNGQLLSQEFSYKPAFQVGIGSNFDEWKFLANYTWVRQTTETKSSAPSPEPVVSGIGNWVVNNWIEQFTASGRAISGPYLTSEWKLGLDLIDLMAGRPYYEGKTVTISPEFGLRGALIRQHLNLDLTVSSLVTTLVNSSESTIFSKTFSNSWGIGPIGRVSGSCLLGNGFRIKADTALASLYTTYTNIKHSENVVSTSPYPGNIGVRVKDGLHVMRPELEMSLGLSWGSYLCNEKFHINVYAGYDFNIFWNQNMIRTLMDETLVGIAANPGSLYLQGLNIQAVFDF